MKYAICYETREYQGFAAVVSAFVYNLSTKLFAYNLAEDTCRFLLHLLGVVGVEVLRDR